MPQWTCEEHLTFDIAIASHLRLLNHIAEALAELDAGGGRR